MSAQLAVPDFLRVTATRRPRLGRLGDLQGTVQGGVGNVLNGLCPSGQTAQQCLQSGIGQVCPANQQANCQAAITAYQNIGPAASSALLDFSQGNTVGGIQACLPLIGMAVSVSPAGPVAGAVVVGALSLAIDVLQALGLFNSTPAPAASCNYVIWPIVPYWGSYAQDGVCFSNPSKPPGPIDPNGNPFPGWLTMEQFMSGSSAQLGPHTASWSAVKNDLTSDSDPTLGPDGNPYTTWADIAFGSSIGAQNYNWFQGLRGSLAACGVSMITVRGQPAPTLAPMSEQTVAPLINPQAFQQMLQTITGNAGAAPDITMRIGGFISAYCQVFLRGICERIINNHNPVDPLVLLESCAQAWNAAHDDSAQYTFGTGTAGSTPYNFVEAVIQGFVALPPQQFGQTPQGNEGWSQKINVGPPKGAIGHIPLPIHLGPFPPKGVPTGTPSFSSSTAGTVLLVAGGLAALGAGGVYLYARNRGMTFGQAIRSGWARVRHPTRGHRHPPRRTRARR